MTELNHANEGASAHRDADAPGGPERVPPDDFRALADAMAQLAWIATAAGRVVWFNARWYEFAGLTPSGRVPPDWTTRLDGGGADGVTERFRRAIEAGRPWEDTFALRRHDGELRWFLSRAVPGHGRDGTVRRWYGTHTDITERRDTEARMRRSEERFRRLVDAAAAVIWTTTPAGALVPPQPRWTAFTGQTDDELAGHGWLEAVHPDDRTHTAKRWANSLERRESYDAEYRLRRRDGEWRDTEVRGVPVLERDGSVREWVGINIDVTERKRAEYALTQARDAAETANRAKSQFLANMSHELRTPLSAVIGYTEMLGEEIEDLGAGHLLADTRKIEGSARHLLGLINDVLDISKIEAGRMTVSIGDFDVRALVDDVVVSVGTLAERNGNTLALDAPADLGRMRSDDTKIRQCLVNLLGNAAKFTTGGTIALSIGRRVEAGQDRILFSVRDTGIGMSPEQLGRLFERFSQADESTTRQFGGTGLGLAITKALTEKLGGVVRVTSAVGEGSTFTLDMPAHLDS